jgi:hypothetical protein
MPHVQSNIERIILKLAYLIQPDQPNINYEVPPNAIEVVKVPYVRDSTELPKICISIDDGHLEPATAEDNFAYYGIFGVTFTFIDASDQKLKQEWPLISDKRSIKKYILNFFPLIPAYSEFDKLDDINEISRPIYDPSKLAVGYNYSDLNFEFKTQESR